MVLAKLANNGVLEIFLELVLAPAVNADVRGAPPSFWQLQESRLLKQKALIVSSIGQVLGAALQRFFCVQGEKASAQCAFNGSKT